MDGLTIARERITREADEKTGFLDLGMLGLNELPDELFALTHLRQLNLGDRFFDEGGEFILRRPEPRIGPNSIGRQTKRLAALIQLQALFLNGTDFADLAPLQALTKLQMLNCSYTKVSDLTPLQALTDLQALDCSSTQVSRLDPLQALTDLQALDCSSTQVSRLDPLQALTNLQALDCSRTQVSDLTPLQALTNLQTLGCSVTKVSDLAPLQALTDLRALECVNTQVNNLAPLQALTKLQMLNCSYTKVSDLTPLQALTDLQTLECSVTKVSDLTPLQALTKLQTLDCSYTEVSDLAPLQALTKLQTLECYHTKVSRLDPLQELPHLRELNFSNCPLASVPDGFWLKQSMEELILYETDIPGIPSEVLSQSPGENCLDALRAHLRDLAAGQEGVSDIKLMVLGNGRVGKTQICRRLRGESYDETVESTHGITVTSALLSLAPRSSPARLQIWDFGGQDIYHGTHALFMRSRAIFLIAWTPEFEDMTEHSYGGFVFRNQHLPYWLDYVRQFGGDDSPVIIVQACCDAWNKEQRHPPVSDETLDKFRLPPRVVHYSSLTNYGRANLDEALQRAADYLREQHGTAVIGAGRAKVKRRIEAMRDADAALQREERQHRTISHEAFLSFCAEAGSIDQPQYLLSYLHNAGIVFYRPGLFDDRIIIDQGWALEAIYTVFHREKSFKKIERQHGRFTRSDLAEWIWDADGYGVQEQELFLSMMQSCGICFEYRAAVAEKGIEAEYIAPDLLPEKSKTDVEQKWDADRRPIEGAEFTYSLLPPSLMGGIISRIGSQAGLAADYWRGGVYVYEAGTKSKAVIEQEMEDSWHGHIRLQTQAGQAALLLARLVELVQYEQQRLGVVPDSVSGFTLRAETGGPLRAGKEFGAGTHDITGALSITLAPATLSATGEIARDAAETSPPLTFVQETAPRPEYFVSYARKDDTPEGREREAIVDQLCAAAEQKGITILRDEEVLEPGDRISKFMNRIGRGDRIFVVLSDKYLKSAFCMIELHEIWRDCRQKDEEFLKRIRVFTLADAKIWTPKDRALCAAYWRKESQELEAVVREHGYDILGEEDYKRYRLMKEFAHQIGNILATVTDILQPRRFEQLVRYGFDDPPADAPDSRQIHDGLAGERAGAQG